MPAWVSCERRIGPSGPVDLNPTGASDVGALYHRTGDLQVGNVGAEQDERTGLDVDADTDNQVSKAFKTIVVSHARHGQSTGESNRARPRLSRLGCSRR